MKQKDFLFILIPLFILTVLWVIFSVYHNYVTSTIKDPLTYQIIPIEGKFDTDTLDQLEGRLRVNPSYEIIVTAPETPTPTPVILDELEEEIGSESAEISPVISEVPTEE